LSNLVLPGQEYEQAFSRVSVRSNWRFEYAITHRLEEVCDGLCSLFDTLKKFSIKKEVIKKLPYPLLHNRDGSSVQNGP